MSSEQSTLFAEASLASHTVLPGSDEARQMTATSGRNIAALLTLSGPLGSLVKMCLESEQLFSTRCYLTWKTSATPGGRLVFRLAPSTRGTSESVSLLWPTLSANNQSGGVTGLNGGSGARAKLHKMMGRDMALQMAGGQLNPDWAEWLMGFPIGWTDLER